MIQVIGLLESSSIIVCIVDSTVVSGSVTQTSVIVGTVGE